MPYKQTITGMYFVYQQTSKEQLTDRVRKYDWRKSKKYQTQPEKTLNLYQHQFFSSEDWELRMHG